jgi:hypothetical protein
MTYTVKDIERWDCEWQFHADSDGAAWAIIGQILKSNEMAPDTIIVEIS